ncbi:MAG: hypothetical protein KAT35_05585, partial [Candidatus Aenigmarchaeota archaeon]|nr:hypothetical protein [Candidatus Aenigmarchaeota archaeon]
EETELYTFQGLGVTQYGLPVLGAGAPIGVEVVAAGSDAYISLILRNNAEGSEATNIKVSLQNIEPFQVRECGSVYGPTENRATSGGVPNEYCPPYQEDGGYPYSTHFVSRMFPDEEIEYFWTLRAPESEKIGNMYYEQKIYYTVEFHYKVSMYQSLMAMTQAEFTRRSSEGKAVTGTSETTNGEIRIRSTTNEPVRYSADSSEGQSLLMEYEISNINPAGIPKPESKVILSLTVPDSYVSIPSDIGDWEWTLASHPSCTVSGQSCSDWLESEYEITNTNIVDRTIIKEINAYILRDVNDEYTIYAPLELESGILPSVLSLPFYVRASYDYLLDGQGLGSTTLGVEPRGV